MNSSNPYFSNLVVLITGSSHGLGKTLATSYSALGATVIINYHQSKQDAIKTLKIITNKGGKASIIKADVSRQKQVRTMVKKIVNTYGKIDILINNAGGVFENIEWDLQTQHDWDRTIALNLTGCYNCLLEVGKVMKDQKHGKIVNISSLRSFLGAKDIIAYSASKAGINNLTKSFAKILHPHVNINCIAPGRINTDSTDTNQQSLHHKGTLRSVIEPLDVFYATKFLTSPESDHITGQTLIVDSGVSLQ